MMLLPNYSPVKKKDTAVKVQPTNKWPKFPPGNKEKASAHPTYCPVLLFLYGQSSALCFPVQVWCMFSGNHHQRHLLKTHLLRYAGELEKKAPFQVWRLFFLVQLDCKEKATDASAPEGDGPVCVCDWNCSFKCHFSVPQKAARKIFSRIKNRKK